MNRTPYPLTCGYLRLRGIDPDTVSIEHATKYGYRQFVLDKEGKRLSRAAWTAQVRGRSWPSPAIGLTVATIKQMEDGE